MPELIAAFDAFMQEHRRCGEIDGGVDAQHAWLTCACGARITRPLVEPPAPRLRGEMPIARQMLRVLFPDRIVFSPDAAQETVELRADCAVGSVFERLLVPKTVVTAGGYSEGWNASLAFRIEGIALAA